MRHTPHLYYQFIYHPVMPDETFGFCTKLIVKDLHFNPWAGICLLRGTVADSIWIGGKHLYVEGLVTIDLMSVISIETRSTLDESEERWGVVWEDMRPNVASSTAALRAIGV